MKRILITGIGGDIAQNVAKLVRDARPDAWLIGSDLHDEHAGPLFVDECVLLPPARDGGYRQALRELIAQRRIDLVIPVTEAELGVIADVLGESSLVPWVSPGARVVAAGIDKLQTARAITALELPVPWTMAAGDGEPPEYPCLLKPRFGSGSRGIFVVTNADEAICLARKFPDSILQELLEPHLGEVTCAVYRTRDGRIATLQMLRRLVGGLTGWARVISDDAVEQMCHSIAQGLELRGSMNVQLRLTEAGPRVFEINPRFSSTVAMRHLVGFSDVAWTLDELDGRPVIPSSVPVGRVAVRVQGCAVLT